MLLATIRRLGHPQPRHEPRTHGGLDQHSLRLANALLGGRARLACCIARLRAAVQRPWLRLCLRPRPRHGAGRRRYGPRRGQLGPAERARGFAGESRGRGHRRDLGPPCSAPPALSGQCPARAQLQYRRGARLLRAPASVHGGLRGGHGRDGCAGPARSAQRQAGGLCLALALGRLGAGAALSRPGGLRFRSVRGIFSWSNLRRGPAPADSAAVVSAGQPDLAGGRDRHGPRVATASHSSQAVAKPAGCPGAAGGLRGLV